MRSPREEIKAFVLAYKVSFVLIDGQRQEVEEVEPHNGINTEFRVIYEP